MTLFYLLLCCVVVTDTNIICNTWWSECQRTRVYAMFCLYLQGGNYYTCICDCIKRLSLSLTSAAFYCLKANNTLYKIILMKLYEADREMDSRYLLVFQLLPITLYYTTTWWLGE